MMELNDMSSVDSINEMFIPPTQISPALARGAENKMGGSVEKKRRKYGRPTKLTEHLLEIHDQNQENTEEKIRERKRRR